MPAFALALRRKVDGIKEPGDLSVQPRLYLGAMGRLLAAFIGAERRLLGVAAPQELVVPGEGDEADTQECGSCTLSS